MADQEDKKDDAKKLSENQRVTDAINALAETEDGIIFFRWLKDQCFFRRSTISGNPQTFEVNTLGSLVQAYQQALWFKISRGFKRNARIKIEVD